MSTSTEQSTCGFRGDNDLYGAGIRIGSYVQWLATGLAYIFASGKTTQLMNITYGFQLAMLIALVYKTARSSAEVPMRVQEAFIMTIFGAGGALSALSAGFLRHLSDQRSSRFADAARQTVLLGFAIYTTWFWLYGINFLKPTKPCPSYAFFFAKVNIRGGFRIFSLVMVLLAVVVLSLNILYHFVLGVAVNWQRKRPWLFGKDSLLLSTRYYPYFATEYAVIVVYTMALGLFVAMIELALKWNEISGVDSLASVGQLIPLITAVGGMSNVVYAMFVDKPRPQSPLALD